MTVPETFRAFVSETDGDQHRRGVREVGMDLLGGGDVLVRVQYSSLNYKDALASTPKGRVARLDPIVPGIDLVGEVVESASPAFAPGDAVVAHGYETGVSRHGGLAEYARVAPDALFALPAGLTPREAMIVGTAGFTAAKSVAALEAHGLQPGDGEVLVTGATGGVGSFAVATLAARGHTVVASSGKDAEADWLRSLGASDVIARIERDDPPKPLAAQRWAGVVDCVGGAPLVQALSNLRYGGSAAISGLTAGPQLDLTVIPFILRGVNLLGIDSVECALEERVALWGRIADDLRPADLDLLARREIGLDDVDAALGDLMQGASVGRTVVAVAPE